MSRVPYNRGGALSRAVDLLETFADEWMTADEMADRLGVKLSTLRRGLIRARKAQRIEGLEVKLVQVERQVGPPRRETWWRIRYRPPAPLTDAEVDELTDWMGAA